MKIPVAHHKADPPPDTVEDIDAELRLIGADERARRGNHERWLNKMNDLLERRTHASKGTSGS